MASDVMTSLHYLVCRFIDRAAILVPERELSGVMGRLSGVSLTRREELRAQGAWLYHTYFSTVEKITRSALDIINHRVYPQHAPHYDYWNLPPHKV